MAYHCALIVICAAFLAGCGAGPARTTDPVADFRPDQRPLASTMVYDCNGYEFIARLGPGEMAVWLPDRYVVLSQVRSASGTRYQEGDIEFWSEAGEAILTLGEEQYFGCVLQPWRVPWEDARRRGVDFRAVGNEPGWSLEIQLGRQLLFVGEDGMRRLATPDPGVQIEGQTRRWHAVTESAGLEVEVIDEACVDTMSGDALPSQVTVTLGAEVLHGCGRDLDYPWE